MNKIAVIGLGKLGSHLYYALKKTGKYSLKRVPKNLSGRNYRTIIDNAGIIFICVQDSKISAAAKILAGDKINLKGKLIFHTSGSLTSEELHALKQKGAVTASFHPVQTFESVTGKDKERFRNIYVALEGSKPAVRYGKQLAVSMGAKPLVISKKEKVYHHICCVIASNFLTSLMSQIEKIGAKKIRINGFKKLSFFNIYKPLAIQTLNNIAGKGALSSLTGPIERNDLGTIAKHVDALKLLPDDLLGLYQLMGIETVKLALEKKSIGLKEAKRIQNAFNKLVKINKIA
jgi:predicted short-subunit dehydrogenase-like oxidoreductase (DUF2520 family)